ncbi:MAG TPA: M56 family metallopeptidase [Allosphingosinicella sp.]|jgi:beta-lactamase regulating signal transducer with metallopeptidase domain|nr:M56 family metallopeptidase [Allosphingosinicella sp.]
MDVSFFVQMAWKSALIAGAALALAYVLRSRAASDRALVLRIGAAMLLALPLIAVALPALPIEAWAAPEATSPAVAAAAPIAPVADLAYVPGPSLPLAALPAAAAAASEAAAPTIWDDPTPLVLFIYLGGLLMVAGRLLAGLFMLRRWTRDARAVTCPEWLAAFDRARGDEKVRLMVSDTVPSPLSWGWRRPVILIDPDTLDEPEEADAILAHELAHVARRDWPALIATRIAAAVFWFNPLVWLLEREIVQQAEEAADCEAAAHVEPARYAQTLLSWAQVTGRAIPANSIAPRQSALGRRIRAILDRRERPRGSAWTKIAAILCVVIAAPVAAVQLVQAAQAPTAPRAPHAPAAPRIIPSPPAIPGVPQPPAPPPALPDVSAEVNEVLAEVLPQIPQIVSSALASVDPDEIGREVEEALREAGPELDRLSREDRVRVGQEVRRALAQARVQVREAVRVQQVSQVQIAQAVREAQRAALAVRPAIAASMRAGAGGMEHGAAGMEQGAQRMEQQAARFRDRNYRETVIARERARGRNVTHEDLLEAAQGMTEGAEGMREGAREMRAAAERMRDGRQD